MNRNTIKIMYASSRGLQVLQRLVDRSFYLLNTWEYFWQIKYNCNIVMLRLLIWVLPS